MAQILYLVCVLLVHVIWLSDAVAQVKGAGATPTHGGSYRRPLANNPSTLDPHLITDTYGRTVAQQLFDGLVQYDGSLTIVPAIAESWKGSRDGLNWTFYLRQGVKFHNGRDVVADDVVYSFTRIIDPKTKSGAAELFMKLKGAKEFSEGHARTVRGLRALDRHTVQMELAEASAPFVSSLAIGYAKIIPREVVEALGPAFGTQPVGTGPFRFIQWKRNEEIILAANPEYFSGRPFLDRLEYKIFTGHQTEQMLKSFEQNDLEDTLVPTAELERFQGNSQYQFVRRPILGVRFLGFNTTQGLGTNRLVRQAFNHAIDRDALVRDVYQNRYKTGHSFLPPGTYGYDPKFNPFPFDPQRSRMLLAKAGYADGKGLPVFQAWSNPKSDAIEQEHEAIRKYLSQVGIRIEFQYNTNWPSFKAQVQEGKLPIFRYGWVADVPEPENFLYYLFHSQSSNNLTRYRNPEVDQLLDRARAEQGYLNRVELYRRIEQLIMEDSPVIPLNYYSYERLFQKYVQSVEVSALGDPYIPMRKVWLAR
jgi:peptide/nickel transport system substrate-binding protein/oligopeptide transport system substrate-binding protein